ncbi:MAG: beta galactosidase jelly roll domain-containing protein [Bacteroidales bacterium]|nr:beta galactosidase jelly roll domain-containing protein [Bacteroidales bacterium]
MKRKRCSLLTIVLLALMFGVSAHAEDLRKIVSLSGYWKFSIGNDVRWASPSYNDADWDEIRVPDRWENQGYNDYNGYAWYRKKFKMGDVQANTTYYLVFGRIDDADVVYFNGKVLGKSGRFPPDFETAADRRRNYVIPAGYLKENAENTIAVQVYDTYLEGGIVDDPAGIYTDADIAYLSVNLTGIWRFHTGDDMDWKAPDFDDADWRTIRVPSEWESQGYADYDGYAWYRVRFKLPRSFRDGEYYLSLGKIDDTDDVYLNGIHVGNVHDLKKDADYKRSGWEFNARRLYKIPEGILKQDGMNTIAVRVYDSQLRGGIYEGPVGIMSAENCRRYRNKYYTRQSLWDYWYDVLVD